MMTTPAGVITLVMLGRSESTIYCFIGTYWGSWHWFDHRFLGHSWQHDWCIGYSDQR